MPAGRPTKYDPASHPERARRLALLGLTDEELCIGFGITRATLQNWDDAHPEFFAARARGKENADAKVAERLYHRALGYHHEDTHISTYQGDVTETPIVKYYPPDTAAAALWLSNRQGGRWKLKSTTQQLDKDGNPTDPVAPVLNVTVSRE